MKNHIFTLSLAVLFLLISPSTFAQDTAAEVVEPAKEVAVEVTPIAAKVIKEVTPPAGPNIEELKANFEKLISEYRVEDQQNKTQFIELLESFSINRPSYNDFQKRWRALAYNALDFPDSFPVYEKLEEIVDQFPTKTKVQNDIAKSMRDELYQAIESKRSELNSNFSKINDIRSNILKNELNENNLNIFGQHSGAIEDIKLETRLVSYQYKSLLQQKISLLKNNFYGGFAGMSKIVFEVFLILLAICLPFIFHALFVRFSNFLDIKQREYFRKGYRNKNYRSLALWIQRINPFLTWIFIILLVNASEVILTSSSIYDFIILLSPFIKAYAYYRIFRVLIEMALTRVLRSIGTSDKVNLKERLVTTSKFIGRYFLILFCILYAVENAVSQGLIYIQVKSLALWVSFFVLSYAFSKWSEEIASYVEHISSAKPFKIFADLCRGKFKILFSLPAVCLIVGHIVLFWVYNWLKRFEIVKKISLKLLRVRLESSQKTSVQTVELPPEYVDTFNQYFEFANDRWTGANSEFTGTVVEKINHWHQGQDDENTISISGENGLGKSFFMKHLEVELQEKGIDATYISIDEKITNPSSIEKFLEDKLNIRTSKNKAKIEGEDEESDNAQKRVILVDNTQNLFLGKLGGFDGFDTFMQIINSNYKNVLWCCSITEQSWIYLNCVTDSTHYFRSHFKMPKWKDTELNKLITNAHNKTDFKYSFDKILFSASNQGQNNLGETFNIEERFFQLLWEQSEGNPEVAKNLWLSSITGVYGNHITVGLPKDVHLQASESLTQNMLFIFAATFRHQNLNIKEASLTTNLPIGLVRQAYKRGLEEGIISKDQKSGRYEISIQWTHSVIKHLKRKNYLYGNS